MPISLCVAALLSYSCSDDAFMSTPVVATGNVMQFGATINQENLSRADESGFADGDNMGIFVVDYDGDAPGELSIGSNRANNARLTFNADANTWSSNTDIYWRDETTPVDVYGYYPYDNGLDNVEAYPFEVSATQDVAAADGNMGHYEASDFLWAKAARAVPGERVNLSYSHRMAGVRVVLQEGNGFAAGEWAKLKKQVTVDNTSRSATINFSTGRVAVTGEFDRNITMAKESQESESYRAVVVPQSVANGKSIIGITIDGVTSNFVREGGMDYAAGKLHTFTIKVGKHSHSGDYELTLVDESISAWVADELSHDFEANTYVVVHVAKAGTLESVLSQMGLDKSTLTNLKLTGELTDADFYFMRDQMTTLASVNLKDVKLVQCSSDHINQGPVNPRDNYLPWRAFREKQTLRRLILPESMEFMSPECLYRVNLTSTLVIPESVWGIEYHAMAEMGDQCTIVLPGKLKLIGGGAFAESQAHINLKLPNTLEEIGGSAFWRARNVTGTFSLPANLKVLGNNAFWDCGHDLSGDIIIPEAITEIPNGAFRSTGFKNGTNVIMHAGIKRIGSSAFDGLTFNSSVNIPRDVTYIDRWAFQNCKFAGGVSIPDRIAYIEYGAFAFSNYSGKLDYPKSLDYIAGKNGESGIFRATQIDSLVISDNILQINYGAFESCDKLKYVSIGKNVGFIAARTFSGCSQLSLMVCLAEEPPKVENNNAFDGILMDKAILEVPAQSVEAYRRASGWNQFQNITAHRELSFNIPDIKCLNSGTSQSGIIRAESAWEVTESPSWVRLSATSGTGKDELTVTVDPLAKGSGTREGRIVFSLKGKSYTTYTTVKQYDYEYGEDSEIVLQSASASGNPVDIFIVGDGFGAESIVDGTYMATMRQNANYLLSIEPFKTYANHFTVHTAVACSPDDGTGDVINLRRSRLGTRDVTPDVDKVVSYVKSVSPSCSAGALIIVVSNYGGFSGSANVADDKFPVATVCLTDGAYPYDQRGLVQHYAGGRAFAGLGIESVSHIEFIRTCQCPFCNALSEFNEMKSKGRFENLTMSGKMADAPWAQFMFHDKYSAIVDMYEGGFDHTRGVWRSEPNSVMNTFIPYYNTISRYAIYKEIMRRAGLNASIDDFIANDKIELVQ